MTKPVAVCVTLLLLGAIPSGALDLQLQPTKTAYRSGEPIVVRILVVNPLSWKDIWYLKRGFWLVPYSDPMDGDLGLMIQVRGSNSELLKGTQASMIVVRSQTHPAMFLPLYPGSIFGEDIALDGPGLEYDMKKPGRYRVTATMFAASPRTWFDKWRKANPGDQYVPFKREQLFDGPDFTPAVDLQVAE